MGRKRNSQNLKDCKIKVHGNFNNKFVDLTLEPFVYQYPPMELVENHRFHHMGKGVYKAESAFQVSTEEMDEIIRTYRDLRFYGYDVERGSEIWFALSKTGCIIEDYEWWEDNAFMFFPEVNSLRRKGFEDINCYEYENGDYVVVPEDEEIKPLPEKKQAMNFIYNRYVREDGTIPRIMLQGYIADMVEPGIYYFNKQRGENLPELSLMTKFNNMDVAVVAQTGYGISTSATLRYIAIEKQNFKRLKLIADSTSWYFYHEFVNTANELKEEADIDINAERENQLQWPEGQELVPGIGTENVELCFEIPLVVKCEFKEYVYAARYGIYLLLADNYTKVLKRYDMRLMTHLAVKKKEKLRCGYEYDTILKVIDCEEEKYKEILKPCAYELYEKQWKSLEGWE